jgi:hypothetical protein
MESRAFELTKRLKDKEAEHIKAMVEVMESATTNYTALEQEHFKAIRNMKKAEEKAKNEAEQKAKMEAEVAQLQEKVRLLEVDCIQLIGKAREEGKQEVLAEVRPNYNESSTVDSRMGGSQL